MRQLADFLEAAYLGGLTFLALLVGNHLLAGIIAGLVVFSVVHEIKKARTSKKLAKVHEAEIVAEERLRHRVRQELASQEAVSGALPASSTGLPARTPDQSRLSLVGGDSGPAAGARRHSRVRTVLVLGSPVIMVALIVLLLLLGQLINHGSL
jgi:hypothetical protein